MPDGFTSLADIINKDPAFDGLRKLIKQSDIVSDFVKIFPDLGKIAAAVKVDRKTLYLKVENPAWRSELKFKESLIIQKVNGFYKENRIKNVRFVS